MRQQQHLENIFEVVMNNVQLGKIRRLLSIRGLSWAYIAAMFRGVSREDVKQVARTRTK